MDGPSKRTLAIIYNGAQENLASQGTLWHVRKYEAGFDEVLVLCLFGAAPALQQGATRTASLGGRHWKTDLLLAPLRIYRHLRARNPTVLLTYDAFFTWWTTALFRLLLRRPVVISPVAIPERLYQMTGTPLFGLPIRLERLFTRMSFSACDRILAPRSTPEYGGWISGFRGGRSRLRVIDTHVDEFSTPDFYREAVSGGRTRPTMSSEPGELLYVGRLHPQHYALDLIEIMSELKRRDVHAHLTIVGDGPDREGMKRQAEELDIVDMLTFIGSIDNRQVIAFQKDTDVFLSLYAGIALREAALCGTPVVAYKTDATPFLQHDLTALLVPERDTTAIAASMEELLGDPARSLRMGQRLASSVRDRWNPDQLSQVVDRSLNF